jgi:para-aminobenzoate synthetase component II
MIVTDNCDSFVFNIARYFQRLGEATAVVRSDAISVGDLARLTSHAVVMSSGPCTPMEDEISTAVVRSSPASFQFSGSASDINASGVLSGEM